MPPAETSPLIYDDEEAGSPDAAAAAARAARRRQNAPIANRGGSGGNAPEMWTSTERWLGAASVFLLMLTCIFGGLYVAAPRTDEPPKPPPKAPDREAPCLSPDCVLTASKFIEKIDFAADPCQDFWQFSCGSWIKNNPIPDHKSRYGSFDQLAENNRKVLRDILESPYEQTPSVPNSGTEKAVDIENWERLKNIYTTCRNESHINGRGIGPVRDLVTKVRSGFPVSLPNTTEFAGTIAGIHQLDMNSLFGFFVDADQKDPDVNIMYLDQGGALGLPSREYYKDSKVVAVYKSVIADELSNVFAATPTINDTYPVPPNTSWSQVAEIIVTFESKLAEISLPADQIQESNKTYNPFNLTALTQLAPGFNWNTYLDKRFPYPDFPSGLISEKTVIIVGEPAFFGNLSILLASTDTTTLEWYITWRTVGAYGAYVSEPAKEPLRRLAEALTGVKSTNIPPRWEVCVDVTDSLMGFALGKWFVDKVFTPDAKQAADGAIDYIKKMMTQRIPNLEWIDEKTRALAIEKVQSLKRKIGFPPFIQTPSKLKERYKDFVVDSTDYFTNIVNAGAYAVKRNTNKILKPVDKEEWDMTPSAVNAYYNPPLNEIVFPAGILQPPFFSPKFPSYVNYGAIGSVVGHELTHAFDNNGRSYDSNGRLKDWWTPETAAEFTKRSQCFVDQYAKYTVKDSAGKEEHVNGKLTLGENLADNGGLARALEAWKDEYGKGIPVILNRNFILPGLNYTREQMFFVGFAQVWCSSVRPETAIQRIRTDPHSPANWRVIGAISDSADFAAAFNCPKNGPMNPDGKCTLW